MPSEFGFRSGKSNYDWHQLSPSITGYVCWKFHDMAGPSDLSKGVCKHKLWNKNIYTEKVFKKTLSKSLYNVSVYNFFC